jgi:hypothetical protein
MSWTWCSAVRGDTTSRRAICLLDRALGDEPKHVYLAVRETGRPRSPPPGDVITAGRLDDRIHGVAIKATSSRFGTYELRRHLRVECPAIRTPLHERMEHSAA